MRTTLISRLEHWSALLFLPLRRMAGPLHHRRGALDEDRRAREDQLHPLPAPWQHDERWYRGGFPPRAHNALRPLIDGEEYFADLHRALSAARSRVMIAGWCLTPQMALLRGGDGTELSLSDLLHQVSLHAEVFVLLWSGAPVLFQPDVQLVERLQRTLQDRAPRVRCELDRRASFSHDHHQKAITIDGRVAYVGGIDLTTFQGDRWDTGLHCLRFGPNWHDVQMRIEGEAVRDVEANFCQRWNAVTGADLRPLTSPRPDPGWTTPAQIVRTVPAGFYPFAPDGEYGIRHVLLAAIRHAERFIYLENQYLWDREIVDALVEAINRPRSTPFRIIVVLPARAYLGKYDNDEHIRALRKADGERGMFAAYTLYAAGPASSPTGYRYLPIYVHSKTSIVDDEWLSVGSANLNQRGLATDTEMNVQAVAPDVARMLRHRLWAEHLQIPLETIAQADPIDLIDKEWKQIADALEERLQAGDRPPGGQVRHYVPGRNPGSRIRDLIQALTLQH